MKIERVDERTVKCFLSNEELEEYDISYKDFIMRSAKAREVVEDIIIQAEEEVGYQPPRFAFDLQIMMLPDQGMLLTFSERDPEADSPEKEFLNCLKNMRDAIAGGSHVSIAGGDGKLEEWLNDLRKFVNFGKALARIQKNEEQTEEQKYISQTDSPENAAQEGAAQESTEEMQDNRPDFVVFCFARLRSVCQFAAALPEDLAVKSSLYTMEDFYFLFLERGEAPYEDYSRACIQAMEFASIYAAQRDQTGYLEEHGECVIAQDAIRKLRL